MNTIQTSINCKCCNLKILIFLKFRCEETAEFAYFSSYSAFFVIREFLKLEYALLIVYGFLEAAHCSSMSNLTWKFKMSRIGKKNKLAFKSCASACTLVTFPTYPLSLFQTNFV